MAEQINVKPKGRDYRTRRVLKKLCRRQRRRKQIEEDEIGGRAYLRCTYGWMY